MGIKMEFSKMMLLSRRPEDAKPLACPERLPFRSLRLVKLLNTHLYWSASIVFTNMHINKERVPRNDAPEAISYANPSHQKYLRRVGFPECCTSLL
jgi:hypothetical protein